MGQTAEDIGAHGQNFMTGPPAHIGHKANSTGIVFKFGVVETLFGGKSVEIRQSIIQLTSVDRTEGDLF